jgi:ribose 5-phosphate isomerase B
VAGFSLPAGSVLKLRMRIHIGSDHAGLDFKNELITHLVMNGHDVTDHGPYEYDALDDYPDFCIPCAESVAKDPTSMGIVLGGSGNGEQMAANKVKGIRAAREHNNANVIAVGGRMHEADFVKQLIDTFIATPFPGDERHVRRIEKVGNYEVTGDL